MLQALTPRRYCLPGHKVPPHLSPNAQAPQPCCQQPDSPVRGHGKHPGSKLQSSSPAEGKESGQHHRPEGGPHQETSSTGRTFEHNSPGAPGASPAPFFGADLVSATGLCPQGPWGSLPEEQGGAESASTRRGQSSKSLLWPPGHPYSLNRELCRKNKKGLPSFSSFRSIRFWNNLKKQDLLPGLRPGPRPNSERYTPYSAEASRRLGKDPQWGGDLVQPAACRVPSPSLSPPPAQTIAGQSPNPVPHQQGWSRSGAGNQKGPASRGPFVAQEGGRKWVGWAWK